MTKVATSSIRAPRTHWLSGSRLREASVTILLSLAVCGGSAVTFYPGAAHGKPPTEHKGGGNDNKPEHAKGGGKNKKTSDPSTGDGETTTDTPTLPPSLDPIGDQIVTAGETLWITVSASDPEDDPLVLSATNLPTGATFADNGDGTADFAWTTTQEQAGLFRDILFRVSDGVYTASESITIAVNDPPAAEEPSVPMPDVTVFGTGVTEGQAGTTPARFFVVLSEASAVDVAIDYYTVDGTAIRSEDFEFSQGTLIIPAGETEGAIFVPVLGDTIEEGDESFELILDSASNATITTSSALGIIEDDDAPTTATLSWEAPVTNLDGTCADDLEGFRVHAGSESGVYTKTQQVSLASSDLTCEQTGLDATCSVPVQTCTYTMSGLTSGTWFFAVQAFDVGMSYSPFSDEVSGSIP